MKHTILTLSVIAALSACGSSDDEKIIAPTAPEFFVINDNGEKETVETFAAVATKHAETGNPTGLYEISDLNPGEALFYPLEQVGTYGEFSINAKGEWNYTLWRGEEFSATPEHEAITALVKAGLPDLTETFTVTTADGTTKDFTITIKGIDEPATFGGDISNKLVQRDTGKGNTSGTVTLKDANPEEASFDLAQTTTPEVMYGSATFDPATGDWTYDLDEMNEAVISLTDASQSLTDSFTVTSLDGTEQVVSILVKGVDLVAATFAGHSSLAVNEDGSFATKTNTDQGSVTSSITVIDPNFEEAAFKPLDAQPTAFGSVTIDASGLWTYAVDHSKDAVKALLYTEATDTPPTIDDTLTFEAIDGSQVKVTVTIEGTQSVQAVIGNLPTMEGEISSEQVSANSVATSGTLSITDPNAWQASFVAAVDLSNYGTFSIDVAGAWHYELTAETVTKLESGELTLPINDEFTVASVDGKTEKVTFSITSAGELNFGAQVGSSDGSDARWIINMPNETGLKGKVSFTLRVPERVSGTAKDIKVQLHGATRQTAVHKQLLSMVLQDRSHKVFIYDGTGTSTSTNTFAHGQTFQQGELLKFAVTWDSTADTLAANGDKPLLSMMINGKPLTGHASIVDGVFPSFSAADVSELNQGPTLLEIQTKGSDKLDIDDFVVYSDIAGTTEIFNEDFSRDNLTKGGEISVDYNASGTSANSSAVAVEFPVAEAVSTQYAELNHVTAYGLLRIDLPAQIPTGKATMRVKVTDAIQSAYLSLFGNSTEQSRAMVDLNLKTDESTILRGVAEADRLLVFDKNNRTYTNLNLEQTHTKGDWNTVEITWDATNAENDTADGGVGGAMPIVTMTINGEKVSDGGVKITDGAFASPSFITSTVVDGVKMLGFKCGTSAKPDAGTCAIDDIKIYDDLAGTNLILTQDFEKSSLGAIATGVIPAQDETGHASAKYGAAALATVVEVK